MRWYITFFVYAKYNSSLFLLLLTNIKYFILLKSSNLVDQQVYLRGKEKLFSNTAYIALYFGFN